MKKYILLVLIITLFASCNDWLDVTPKDKLLEKDMFSSEDNINNAANGLYREMVSEHLYGGNLSQTTIEMMGHVYAYPPSQPNASQNTLTFWGLANFSYYVNDDIKGRFSNIWKNAYATLLHINTFIKNVKEAPAVMSEKNKNILLGEAYGMRAYIHFDLFRLFGPAWQERTGNKVLFYNDKTDVIINHTGYEEAEYSTADDYMALLLDDIAVAERLLRDTDPVVTYEGSITNELLNDDYYQRNRNRRMNYYAVKGLEARVQQYCGKYDLAAAAATVITDQIGKRFKMVDPPKIVSNQDYIFFSEVIFGINNLNMSSWADTWYMTTMMQDAYVVDKNNFEKNIMGYSGSVTGSMPDWRDRQWKESNVVNYIGADYSFNGNLVSKKYLFISHADGTGIPAIENLQVLMRVSEMFYIEAEAALKAGDKATALLLLNSILKGRGVTEQYFLDSSKSEAELQAHIEKEYYREFIGEGQIFFFHKRLGNTRMFKGYDEGTEEVPNGTASYVVPIPEDETNI